MLVTGGDEVRNYLKYQQGWGDWRISESIAGSG